MVKCDFPNCEEKIEYLPFKCKYCTGVYCKRHRLPENHDCTFEIRTPIQKQYTNSSIPTPNPRGQQKLYNSSLNHDYDSDENVDYYIPRQEKISHDRYRSSSRGARRRSPLIAYSTTMKATKAIMGLNILFYILYLIPSLSNYIHMHVNTTIGMFYFHTIITSMFVPGYGFFGIISLIFSLIIFYWAGQLIEYKFGPKFLLFLYFLGGFLSGILGLIIQSLEPYYFISPFFAYDGSRTIFLAFICYSIGLEREMRFYLYFIPIRLKAKYLLLIIGITSLIFGLLYGDAGNFSSVFTIPLAHYLYKKVNSRIIHSESHFF